MAFHKLSFTYMETFSILKSLLEADRSIRRFDHSRPIGDDTLRKLVDLTRYCASGRNLQPLRYRIVSTEAECEALYPLLAWAGYYKDWDGPAPAERPTAYLVQCLDTQLTNNCLCDDGLQLQVITLGASALGIGGCIIKSFRKNELTERLSLPSNLEPLYVLALGYPSETARIVPLPADGDIRYFRDSSDIQSVPKRPLPDLLID